MILEGVQECLQAWDAAKRRYFEEHLPACKCVSCRADADPFVAWITAKTDQTFDEWIHDPRPPSSVDVIRSLPAFPTFARWWMFLGDVAHLGYRAACAIIWGIGWMIGSIVSAGRTIVRTCVPRFLWPRGINPRPRGRQAAEAAIEVARIARDTGVSMKDLSRATRAMNDALVAMPPVKPPPPPAPPAKRDTGVILRS